MSVVQLATIVVGESEAMDGVGLLVLTVKLAALDVPPPGAGFTTVILGVPELAIFAAGTLAVSWLALT